MSKMKSLFYLSFVLLFIFSCSIDSDETQHQNNEEKDIYSFEEIKSIVEQTLSSGKIFDWQMQNNSMIFSAAMLADSFISIGYNISPDFDLQSNIHIIDVNSEEWTKARVVFIPKPGKENYKKSKSFRPITLSNYLLKGLEKLIVWKVEENLECDPIHKNQHGFLR